MQDASPPASVSNSHTVSAVTYVGSAPSRSLWLWHARPPAIQALAAARRFDKHTRETQTKARKGAYTKCAASIRRPPLTSLGFRQERLEFLGFELFCASDRPLAGIWPSLRGFMPNFLKNCRVGSAAFDPGQCFNLGRQRRRPSRAGCARKVLFQGRPLVTQWLSGGESASLEAFHAAFLILVQITVERGFGDATDMLNLLVATLLTAQEHDFHLQLHSGCGW